MLIKFYKIFKLIFSEIFPKDVFEKVNYTLEGECSKCGDCCRFMYSLYTYSEEEFKFLTIFYPKYKRFRIIGKEENGNLVLACKLIREDGLCPDYKNRLKMCRDYPNPKKIHSGGKLYKRCTYRLKPHKTFSNYMDIE
jgi:hypothetical protein